jgi:hypothetical protein
VRPLAPKYVDKIPRTGNPLSDFIRLNLCQKENDMRARFLVALLCVLGLATTVSAQEKVAVFDLSGIGIAPETSAAASQIFRNELNATGKFVVVPKGDMDTELDKVNITDHACSAVACAADYGYAIRVDKAVIGTITMLGERVSVEVSLVSVVRREVEFSDTFSATSLDDLPMVLRRLAGAVADRRKIESETNRFAITEEETREARRKKSYITSGAGFGVGFPLGSDSYVGVKTLKNLVWVLRYEANKYIVENSIGVSWGNGGETSLEGGILVDERKVRIIPWDIGMRYVFNRESDITPFVGGGLGLHFIIAEDAGPNNYIRGDQAFALHVAAGLYGFQSYDFRLTVEAKYTALFTNAFAGSDTSQQIAFIVTISRKFEPGEHRGCLSGGCLF